MDGAVSLPFTRVCLSLSVSCRVGTDARLFLFPFFLGFRPRLNDEYCAFVRACALWVWGWCSIRFPHGVCLCAHARVCVRDIWGYAVV